MPVATSALPTNCGHCPQHQNTCACGTAVHLRVGVIVRTIWQILFSKGACYIYTTDVTLFFSTTHRHSKKRGISIFLSSVKNKTIQTTMSNQIRPYSTIFISSSQNHHHLDLWYGEHCQTESINISGEFLFLQANHIQLLETHELKAMGLVLFFKPHGHTHPLQIRAL